MFNKLFFCLLPAVFFCLALSAQDDDDKRYRVGIYYGVGPTGPLGALSANRGGYNQFGKMSVGVNLKGGVEWFFIKNNALSIDVEHSFCGVNTDSLDQMLRRRFSSSDYILSNRAGSEITMSQITTGYSHLFRFQRLLIQPKIGIGLGMFHLFYDGAFIAAATSWSTVSSSRMVFYETEPDFYLTLKPELNLKYILREGRIFDCVLGGSASYLYGRPQVSLQERTINETTRVIVLKDRVDCISYNLFFNLILKL